ncbi:MAG: hypothetical protein ACOY3O_13425, partial [Thermodesulfobacteriota bacterium]
WECFDFVHFLCLPKENEPKERAPVGPGPADCLALLKAAWILQTRFAQTCKILFGSFSGAQQVPMGRATLARCELAPCGGLG